MIEVLTGLGLLGLFIACYISGTIVPFSSDIILIALVIAGWDYYLCLLTASVANSLGGMTNYYLGRAGKTEWIKKYSNITQEKIQKMQDWLQGKGAYIAFFSWVPVAGNAMIIALGYLRANAWIVAVSLYAGKLARYIVIVFLTLKGVDLVS